MVKDSGSSKSIPYGYGIAPDPEEQKIVRRIRKMARTMSQAEIARKLNEEGVTCRGNPWLQPTISRVLRRD